MPPPRALSGAVALPLTHPRCALTSITLHQHLPSASAGTPPTSHTIPPTTRGFTTSPRSPASSSSQAEHEPPPPHSSHYDPPSGWLFNVPPGEKYKNEGWERVWVWGFWGSIGVAVGAYAYKPDTS